MGPLALRFLGSFSQREVAQREVGNAKMVGSAHSLPDSMVWLGSTTESYCFCLESLLKQLLSTGCNSLLIMLFFLDSFQTFKKAFL